MAGTYADQATLAADATFRAQVKAALIFNADYRIQANNDGKVIAMAQAVVNDPAPWVEKFANVLAYGSFRATAPAPLTDAEVGNAVNALFDIYAVKG